MGCESVIRLDSVLVCGMVLLWELMREGVLVHSWVKHLELEMEVLTATETVNGKVNVLVALLASVLELARELGLDVGKGDVSVHLSGFLMETVMVKSSERMTVNESVLMLACELENAMVTLLGLVWALMLVQMMEKLSAIHLGRNLGMESVLLLGILLEL